MRRLFLIVLLLAPLTGCDKEIREVRLDQGQPVASLNPPRGE